MPDRVDIRLLVGVLILSVIAEGWWLAHWYRQTDAIHCALRLLALGLVVLWYVRYARRLIVEEVGGDDVALYLLLEDEENKRSHLK